MVSKVSGELIGTFWLVLGGCGSAVLAAAFPAAPFLPYSVAIPGGIAGAAVLYLIASGRAGYSLAGVFASNGGGLTRG